LPKHQLVARLAAYQSDRRASTSSRRQNETSHWLGHHTDHRATIHHQCNQDIELTGSVHKLLGAIDRVHNPATPRR